MNYPEIYNSSDVKLAVLNNITDNKLRRKINSYYEFEFKCFEERLKTEYISMDNVVVADNDTFDIIAIRIEHNSSGKIEYDVKCEHVFYRLNDSDTSKVNYAFTGTPTQIMNDLLDGTDFTLGTMDYSDSVVFAVNRTATIMEIIIVLANTLGGQIGFTDNGFTISILDSLGIDNGFQARIKKNVKGLKYSVENREELRAVYEVDIVDIYKSEELKDLGFSESVAIGDTITIINEVIGINTTQAVFEVEKDVIAGRNLKVTIGNSFESLADELSFITENVVKTDETYYGVKINNDVGIEIERDDKLARTKLNADEFRMQTGDGDGAYTDTLYFDSASEKWMFKGAIDTEDLTVEGNMFIDGRGSATGIWFVGDGTPFTIMYKSSIGSRPLIITGDVNITGNLTVDGTIS